MCHHLKAGNKSQENTCQCRLSGHGMQLNKTCIIYLEMDASGIGLGAGLLHMIEGMNCGHDEGPHNVTLHPFAFASKSLSTKEWQYSNIDKEALGILHRLDKFHYSFAKEMYVFTDHNPLVAMINKDVLTLSQQLLCIMLNIHQYSMHILYKPGSKLYIIDWLSHHNHIENKDYEMSGMNTNIHNFNAIVDIPICTSIENVKVVTEGRQGAGDAQRYLAGE